MTVCINVRCPPLQVFFHKTKVEGEDNVGKIDCKSNKFDNNKDGPGVRKYNKEKKVVIGKKE